MTGRVVRHVLSHRHRAALVALAKSSRQALSDEQLREAIGSYASNVITSLVDRGLIVEDAQLSVFDDGSDVGWVLTSTGDRLAAEFQQPRR